MGFCKGGAPVGVPSGTSPGAVLAGVRSDFRICPHPASSALAFKMDWCGVGVKLVPHVSQGHGVGR